MEPSPAEVVSAAEAARAVSLGQRGVGHGGWTSEVVVVILFV